MFGTCVDWRSGVIRDGRATADRRRLARRSRTRGAARYQPQLETVRSGQREWVVLDVLHREALDGLLGEFGIDASTEPANGTELNRAWHRLDPWPDTVEGLHRLKRDHVIARAPTAISR